MAKWGTCQIAVNHVAEPWGFAQLAARAQRVQGWSATPEEQRIKFVNIINSIRAHPDYTAKYEDNADPYNRGLALEKMLQDVMLKRRKDELELYKLFASDPAFKAAWSQNIEQVLNKNLDNRPSA